jgi:hypothetical protein
MAMRKATVPAPRKPIHQAPTQSGLSVVSSVLSKEVVAFSHHQLTHVLPSNIQAGQTSGSLCTPETPWYCGLQGVPSCRLGQGP